MERLQAFRVTLRADGSWFAIIGRPAKAEADMRIQDVVGRPFAVMVVPCPNCGGPMRLAAIMPVESSPNADEMTYRCDTCDCEFKRVTRPKS